MAILLGRESWRQDAEDSEDTAPMTKQELIAFDDLISFEKEVADVYNAGKVYAPVHLSGGNEDQLLEVFKQIKPHDWVFSTWRSHYHALLHGIPRDLLMRKILAGESITICSPEHRFYSSAICGGNLPIALGVAWSIKYKRIAVRVDNGQPVEQMQDGKWREEQHVWCFCGDMAAEQGAFAECTRYAANHDLPITYVVEDNQRCVNTPTIEAWGGEPEFGEVERLNAWAVLHILVPHVLRYRYTLGWPHMGAGKYVTFGAKKLQPFGGM